MTNSVVIVSIARTPMGGMMGSLSDLAAHELGAVAIKAAMERSGIQADKVDAFIYEPESESLHAIGTSTQALSALQKKLGLEIVVVVRSGAELREVIVTRSRPSAASDHTSRRSLHTPVSRASPWGRPRCCRRTRRLRCGRRGCGAPWRPTPPSSSGGRASGRSSSRP